MGILPDLLLFGVSLWPLILALLVLILTVKVLRRNKEDPLAGLPEIKPHWIQGNMSMGENINYAYERHYNRMKGLRYCTFYNFSEKCLFVLDPDVCSKIMVTDFEYFDYVPFVPIEYAKVRMHYILYWWI